MMDDSAELLTRAPRGDEENAAAAGNHPLPHLESSSALRSVDNSDTDDLTPGVPEMVRHFAQNDRGIWLRLDRNRDWLRPAVARKSEIRAAPSIPHLGRVNSDDRPAARETANYEECLACQ